MFGCAVVTHMFCVILQELLITSVSNICGLQLMIWTTVSTGLGGGASHLGSCSMLHGACEQPLSTGEVGSSLAFDKTCPTPLHLWLERGGARCHRCLPGSQQHLDKRSAACKAVPAYMGCLMQNAKLFA